MLHSIKTGEGNIYIYIDLMRNNDIIVEIFLNEHQCGCLSFASLHDGKTIRYQFLWVDSEGMIWACAAEQVS